MSLALPFSWPGVPWLHICSANDTTPCVQLIQVACRTALLLGVLVFAVALALSRNLRTATVVLMPVTIAISISMGSIADDMEFAAEHFERVAVMRAGAAVADGPSAEIFAPDRAALMATTGLLPPVVARLGARLGLGSTPTPEALLAASAGAGRRGGGGAQSQSAETQTGLFAR
jgi:hypothetical protein